VIVVGAVVVVFGTVVVGLGVTAQEDCLPPAQLHAPLRHSATMLFRHCRRSLPWSPAQRAFIAGRQRFTVHLFLAASPVEARLASPSTIDRRSRDVMCSPPSGGAAIPPALAGGECLRVGRDGGDPH